MYRRGERSRVSGRGDQNVEVSVIEVVELYCTVKPEYNDQSCNERLCLTSKLAMYGITFTVLLLTFGVMLRARVLRETCVLRAIPCVPIDIFQCTRHSDYYDRHFAYSRPIVGSLT